jgi:hypothetical protein
MPITPPPPYERPKTLRFDEVNCYESKNGSVIIYFEDKDHNCYELKVPRHDVKRMIIAGLDALSEEDSRR